MDKTLQIILKVKDEVTQKMGGISKAVSGFESRFSGAVDASNSFAKGIGGVAIALGAFGVAAVKASSDAEQMAVSFTTLLGSAEQSAAFVSEMKKFAMATPFETKDIAQAAQTMLAFGLDVEKVMPAIQMLGDVSLGNKEKFSSLSLAFAQVQATGRLMGQDLLQMINQGFNPLQIISEKTGKSMTQLKGEMEKGAISAQMVSDAFKVATSEGGRFYKGMDAQSKTLAGSWSKLNEVFTNFMKEIGDRLAPQVKKLTDSLTVLIEKSLPPLLDKLTLVFNFLAENQGVFYAIAGAIMGALIPSLLSLIGTLAMAAIVLAPYAIGGAIVGGIVAGVMWIIKNWDDLKQKALDVFGGIADFIKSVWEPVFSVIKTVWGGIISFFSAAWELIKNIFLFGINLVVGLVVKYFEFLGIDIVAVFTKIIEFFKVFFDELNGGTDSRMFEFVEKWTGYWNTIKNVVSESWDKVKQWFLDGLNWLVNKVKEYTTPIREGWKLFWQGVSDITATFTAGIKEDIKQMVNWAIDKINSLIGALNSVASAGASVTGMSIPSLPTIPALAEGGIVRKPTLALIGEAGPEAVVPLSRGGGMAGMSINIVINGDVSGEELTEKVTENIMRSLRGNVKLAGI